MSKDSPSAPSEQTITQTNLPPYADPYFERLLARTEAESNRPYTPYQGERIAQAGTDTLAAQQGIRGLVQSGRNPMLGQAESALTGIASYSPQQLSEFEHLAQQESFGDIGRWTDPGTVESYMDPYRTAVIDAQASRMQDRFGEQQAARDAEAVAAGAFSNSRRGVEDAIAQREINRQINEMEAQGLSNAYTTGADIFGRDIGAELQRRGIETDVFAGNRQGILAINELNQAAQRANQAADLQAQSQRLAAAQALAAQAGQEEGMTMDRINALQGVGADIEARKQAELDLGYSDFVNQRDYDRQQLNFMSGILQGVPVSPESDIRTFSPSPSTASQLAGLGTAAYGAYGASR